MKNGQAVLITILQSPFYFAGFLVGLIVNAVKYGYWVGDNYWDE